MHKSRPPIATGRRALSGLLGCLLSTLLPGAHAEVATGIDAEAGLPYWELREAGMSLRLVQRQPDQTRAFFMARGFSREAVERVARRCVFQTVFKNLSTGAAASPLEYHLGDWQVRSAGKAARILIRESWVDVWKEPDVGKPARIAFEWALFPTQQVYNPGDYNWGMSVFDLAPDSRFELTVVWRQNGVRRSAQMQDIHCAPDQAQAAEAP